MGWVSAWRGSDFDALPVAKTPSVSGNHHGSLTGYAKRHLQKPPHTSARVRSCA